MRVCFRPKLLAVSPLIIALAALPALAQENSAPTVVRIGVAMPSSGSTAALDLEVRDHLIKAVNRHKADKKLKSPLEAIALEEPPGGRAIAEAEKKNCGFVLYIRVKALPAGHQTARSADGSTISDQPVSSYEVEYLLRGVNDGNTYARSSVQGGEFLSDREAILQAVGMVGGKLAGDLAKNRDLQPIQTASTSAIEKLAPAPVVDAFTGHGLCEALPATIPHVEALRGVCEYAMSLQQKMPNFVCEQETSRYRGTGRVPIDLITATVRYEDGDESYSNLKWNGKPAPESVARTAGLWSSGQFEGNLRAIFHLGNHPVFEMAGVNHIADRAAWIFSFRIPQQIEPLWQLRDDQDVIAPAYGGELWIDQKTGAVLRFISKARDIPATFAMESAEISTDYTDVEFSDGTSFVLPTASNIATKYRGVDPTRNAVQFRDCRKFRAKVRMLVDVPINPSGTEAAANSEERSSTELAQNRTIYEIFREQAIRDDDALIAAEQPPEIAMATILAFRNLAALERQRMNVVAQQAASEKASSTSSSSSSSSAQGLTTIRVNVNLVPVSVVTRDAGGRAVGSLIKDDFRLFDEKKPQVISRFSVEKGNHLAPGHQMDPATEQGPSTEASSTPKHRPSQDVAQNNVALLFDDLHAVPADLASVKEAAARHLGDLQPRDRVALFTTSGDVALDFTTDREKIQAALQALKAHSTPGWNCPAMNYFEADQIVNHANPDASEVAIQDALSCGYSGTSQMKGTPALAERLAMSRALEVAVSGRVESDRALAVLRELIDITASLSGRRTIVLISPGFLTASADAEDRAMAVIDLAVKAGIVINTLDLGGVPGTGVDLTNPGDSLAHRELDRQDATARNELMADLAYGTGGTFFHNNNDMNEGFRRTSETPEFIYVLGFSPQKLDGKFHRLKVALNGQHKLTVQARPGYYAVKPAANP
jgi:VWFA-related protein